MSNTVLSEKAFTSGMTLIYTAWHSLKPPEKTVSFFWFKLLSDIEDEVFLQACLSISTTGERAPQNIIAAVREQAEKLSGKIEWTEAYDTVKELFDHFYFPELGASCWGVIQDKIKEMNKPELIFPKLVIIHPSTNIKCFRICISFFSAIINCLSRFLAISGNAKFLFKCRMITNNHICNPLSG